MRNIGDLSLILIGNCRRKERERTQRGERMPTLFPPRFSPSAVLAPPPSSPPLLLQPGNLSEGAQNKAAKEGKRKRVKAVYRRRKRRRRRRRRRGRQQSSPSHNSSVITPRSSRTRPQRGSALLVVFNAFCRVPPQGSHFSGRLQQRVWQELGRTPPGPLARRLPVRSGGCRRCFHCDTPGGSELLMWRYDHSRTDTSNFPLPFPPLFSYCGLCHYVSGGSVSRGWSCKCTKIKEESFLSGWFFFGELMN